MANQPSFIPSAWAANNSTTETIPATTTESGKASWDQGFPVETSLPLSEGGIPPKYGDFNGVLNVLSQFCVFAQAGGQFTWSSTLSYSVGSIVVGSDGSIYRAVQATTNVNPVGDTSGKWERIVSKSDIDALEADIQTAMTNASDAVSNASAAQSAVSTLGANVVKLSGDQTIDGTKTFSSSVYTEASFLCKQNFAFGTWPSSTVVPGIGSRDKNNLTGSWVGFRYASTLTSLRLYVRKSDDSSTAATSLPYVEFAYGKDTGVYSWAPKTDNAYYLGYTSARWKQLYAGTTTIATSDERLKDNISAVPDSVLDAWGDVDWSQFQFRDAIAEKGENKARLHNGLVAQRIDAAFKAHGQDASRYGLFCYDEWEATPEEKDEQGNVTEEAKPAGNIYSLRYEEALCMEAAYQRRRADRAEARISALERRLNEMEAAIASLISPVGDETYAEPEQEQDAKQEGEE